MALIYVAHKRDDLERAKDVTLHLQKKDLENCYICPVMAFQHLANADIGFDAKIAVALDILTVCDVLAVASDTDDAVNEEIEFANLVGMEVVYLDDE